MRDATALLPTPARRVRLAAPLRSPLVATALCAPSARLEWCVVATAPASRRAKASRRLDVSARFLGTLYTRMALGLPSSHRLGPTSQCHWCLANVHHNNNTHRQGHNCSLFINTTVNPVNPTNPTNTPSQPGGMSITTILTYAGAGIVGLGVIVGAAYCCCCRKKKSGKAANNKRAPGHSPLLQQRDRDRDRDQHHQAGVALSPKASRAPPPPPPPPRPQVRASGNPTQNSYSAGNPALQPGAIVYSSTGMCVAALSRPSFCGVVWCEVWWCGVVWCGVV